MLILSKDLPLKTKISRHFTLKEVTYSETAIRNGINNLPQSQAVLDNLVYLGENLLDPLREQYGPFSPNSVYRSPELEFIICASSYKSWCLSRKMQPGKFGSETWRKYLAIKDHPKGQAADIEVGSVSNYELATFILKNVPFKKLCLEFYTRGEPSSGWVHAASAKDENLCKEVYTYQSKGGPLIGLVE